MNSHLSLSLISVAQLQQTIPKVEKHLNRKIQGSAKWIGRLVGGITFLMQTDEQIRENLFNINNHVHIYIYSNSFNHPLINMAKIQGQLTFYHNYRVHSLCSWSSQMLPKSLGYFICKALKSHSGPTENRMLWFSSFDLIFFTLL